MPCREPAWCRRLKRFSSKFHRSMARTEPRESVSHRRFREPRPWRTPSVISPGPAYSAYRLDRRSWLKHCGNDPWQRRQTDAGTRIPSMSQTILSAAYGGGQWSPRVQSMIEDMATTWGDWGVSSEIGRLHAVLLRRPGPELDGVTDFDAMQMRSDLVPDVVRQQHDAIAEAYRAADVVVHYVERGRIDKPNAMFVRDLMLMTPEGAIVTRPASTVRAGEERLVAEALSQLGVPILMSVHGSGTFEGADVIWVDEHLCFLAEGLRTNEDGADQVERTLREIGVKDVVRVGLPHGAMHLDGLLAILDRDLAVVWPRRTPFKVVNTLRN